MSTPKIPEKYLKYLPNDEKNHKDMLKKRRASSLKLLMEYSKKPLILPSQNTISELTPMELEKKMDESITHVKKINVRKTTAKHRISQLGTRKRRSIRGGRKTYKRVAK